MCDDEIQRVQAQGPNGQNIPIEQELILDTSAAIEVRLLDDGVLIAARSQQSHSVCVSNFPPKAINEVRLHSMHDPPPIRLPNQEATSAAIVTASIDAHPGAAGYPFPVTNHGALRNACPIFQCRSNPTQARGWRNRIVKATWKPYARLGVSAPAALNHLAVCRRLLLGARLLSQCASCLLFNVHLHCRSSVCGCQCECW